MVFAPAVRVTGEPRLALTVGATRRFADYVETVDVNAHSLVGFHYTVAADDVDVNGIGFPADGLALDGGAIAASDGGAAAVLDYAARAAGGGHKVDGGAAASDTTAPGLATAAVDGATLVLTFDEALDPDSPPAAGAFTVTVAGSARTVSGAALSGRTVTLTLASAVTHDQAVTVSYTVPESNPVQDAAGNDVAAFADREAVNTTPAPNGPAITSIAFNRDSTPASGDTYRAGETITVTVTYSPRGERDRHAAGGARYSAAPRAMRCSRPATASWPGSGASRF